MEDITLTIVTPAHNEALNLPALRGRLEVTLGALGTEWEWIIVDDGSRDDTYALVRQWAATERRIRGARLSRNYGSHGAIACGFKLARGDAIAFIAADLQDPPEIVSELFARWRAGAKVVWGVRQQRGRAGLHTLFYAMLRRGEGLAGQPLEGGDVVLIDRAVAAVLTAHEEPHSNLFARIRLAGFAEDRVAYRRDARHHGRSGWTLRKKMDLALDSLTGFDHGLVRAMTYLGLLIGVAGLALAICAALHAACGGPAGWSSIMAAILVLGGVQMIFLGLLGEYAWRTLEAARGRPQYVIEALTGDGPDDDTSRAASTP